ncbi:energy transducer TonB [Pinibacter soli]|uniref:Energy transducer TonB n=1 Tax=Pinibacter soli TaxID=3044211 RepID=A0ABT6RHZ7_9BACT|nr:energy transducer TonB [Pinibacter soli]MDI3322041.1 energy transducer TonB [Pinibacter soli]
MKKILVLVVVLFVSIATFSQVASDVPLNGDAFGVLNERPRFPSGDLGWHLFVNHNLSCPDSLRSKNQKQTVVIGFTVDKDGTLSDYKFVSGAESLKHYALDCIKKSPKWIPGRQNGSPIKFYHEAAIVFEAPITFDAVEIEPEFPKGESAWEVFLQDSLQYPKYALVMKIEGVVKGQFLVGKDGTINQIKALSGPEELQSAAIDVIKKSPRWTPGLRNGNPVVFMKTCDIHFLLANDKSKK